MILIVRLFGCLRVARQHKDDLSIVQANKKVFGTVSQF
jgi:hypothetical protein